MPEKMSGIFQIRFWDCCMFPGNCPGTAARILTTKCKLVLGRDGVEFFTGFPLFADSKRSLNWNSRSAGHWPFLLLFWEGMLSARTHRIHFPAHYGKWWWRPTARQILWTKCLRKSKSFLPSPSDYFSLRQRPIYCNHPPMYLYRKVSWI